MSIERPIVFLGSSRKDLGKLPKEVQTSFAQGLFAARTGKTPAESKVLKGFGGRQVVELMEDHRGDTYRAVYTVKFKRAVYVLHVFKKKSTRGITTPKKDRELIEKRMRDAIAHHKKMEKMA